MLTLIFKYLKFKDSDYKNASANSFMKTVFNTSGYGEFLTYYELEELKGYNKLMTNLYSLKKIKPQHK